MKQPETKGICCGNHTAPSARAVPSAFPPVSHSGTRHLSNSLALSTQTSIYSCKPRQDLGIMPGNFLKLSLLASVTYLQQEKQANICEALNNESPPSPLTQWSTKHSQTTFTVPSFNISFEFWVNDFSFESVDCQVTHLTIRHSTYYQPRSPRRKAFTHTHPIRFHKVARKQSTKIVTLTA